MVFRFVAITRDVSISLGECELTFLGRQTIDIDRAREQHACYRACLRRFGAMVVRLPAQADQPDSVFVEDTAVITDEVAVLCSMGVATRRGETSPIARQLQRYRNVVSVDSAAIEGGDVLKIGRTFLVGQSTRTSVEGIQEFRNIVEPWGYSVITVPVTGALHLKTAICGLGGKKCLVNSNWIDVSVLKPLDLVNIPPEEPFGANLLRFGNHILVAQNHQQTARLLSDLGFQVTTVDISELAKAEAGLTCLSLILPRRSI